MNNVTFQNNPQDNSRVVVLTRGEHLDAKAAKLDNKTKRPALVGHYNDELAKMVKIVEEVKSENHGYDAALGRLGISTVYYAAYAQNVSARKLKVKGGVVDKNVLAKYNKSIVGMKPIINMPKQEEPIHPSINSDLIAQFVESSDKDSSPMVMTFNKPTITMPKESFNNDLSDTRVRRLERTGEIPIVREELPTYSQSNVINTPERFVPKQDAPVNPVNNVTAFPSRMERMQKEQVEVNREEPISVNRATPEIGQGAKELDKINNLMHGSEAGDLSIEIQNAHRRLEEAVKENRRVVNQSASIEEEIRNVKATVEKLRKEKAEAQQRELDKTLDMIEATKEENLGATRRMTNLQAELAELIRQRDEMLNDTSYSRGRAA